MADDLGDDWWQSKSSSKLNDRNKKKRKRNEDSEDVTEKETSIHLKTDSSKKKIKFEVEDEISTEEVEPVGPISKSKKHRKKKVKTFEGKIISTSEAMIKVIDDHFSESLSAVERGLVELKDEHFSACNDGSHTITSFIKTLFPKWKKALKGNDGMPGKPILLIVCSSALRCVELIKQMSDLKSDKCVIAKLFAKHMKLEETQNFLKSKTIHVAVGTPNRLHSLISSGDLVLDCTKHILFDVSHRDVKKCTMFDIKIVKSDLMNLLKDFIIPHVKKDYSKIDLF